MSTCSAYGCTNRCSKKIPGVTFHAFPKNKIKRAAWIKAVRRKNWTPTVYSRLCSEHFSEDQIDRSSLACVRLRENAVPNIFKGFPAHLQQKMSSKPVDPMTHYASEESVDDPLEHSVKDNAEDTNEGPVVLSNSSTESASEGETELQKPVVIHLGQYTVKEDSISQEDSNDSDDNFPSELYRIQENLQKAEEQSVGYMKKIEILQKIRHEQKRIISDLKLMIKHLRKKNAMNDDDLESMSDAMDELEDVSDAVNDTDEDLETM
ncbi:THAP domain-containing protein 1, partial [Stegodyphus mimosarum]